MFSAGIVVLCAFVLGFLCGIFTLIAYGLYRVKKYDKKVKNFIESLKKLTTEKSKSMQSIKKRLDQAFDITDRQLAIMGMLDMPQTSASHGKYKNQLVSELKQLEEEKMGILKSILQEGHDPSLVVLKGDGQKEVVKLSEFIRRQEQIVAENQVPPPPRKPDKPMLKVVKFEDPDKGEKA